MCKPEMILPVVHLNGTSKERLIELRVEAHRKIDEALKALGQMAPNGRDYYPVPGLLEKAQSLQHLRAMTLVTLLEQLEAEVAALEEA